MCKIRLTSGSWCWTHRAEGRLVLGFKMHFTACRYKAEANFTRFGSCDMSILSAFGNWKINSSKYVNSNHSIPCTHFIISYSPAQSFVITSYKNWALQYTQKIINLGFVYTCLHNSVQVIWRDMVSKRPLVFPQWYDLAITFVINWHLYLKKKMCWIWYFLNYCTIKHIYRSSYIHWFKFF